MGVETTIPTPNSKVTCNRCRDVFEVPNAGTMVQVREALDGSGWLVYSRKYAECAKCLKTRLT